MNIIVIANKQDLMEFAFIYLGYILFHINNKENGQDIMINKQIEIDLEDKSNHLIILDINKYI